VYEAAPRRAPKVGKRENKREVNLAEFNQMIAGWVQDRENLDRDIVILKLRGATSCLQLNALVKSRSDLDDKIIRVGRCG
jgi:hypothetical protein